MIRSTTLRSTTLALVLTLGSLLPSTNAASQDDCSIWLCLPQNFGPGCGAARSAMLRRLAKFPPSPPLPSWSACSVRGPISPSVQRHFRQGWDPFYPCRTGYELRARRDSPGREVWACVSPQSFWKRYAAEPRPNGGRYVQFFEDGYLVFGPTADKHGRVFF